MDKGQMSFEYMIALVVFLSITIFVFSQVNQQLPYLHSKSVSNKLKAQAYEVTDLLIHEKRFGLVGGEYKTTSTELDVFNGSCNRDYEGKKNELGLGDKEFNLRIIRGTEIWECGKGRVPAPVESIVVERYLKIDNEIGEMRFEVW